MKKIITIIILIGIIIGGFSIVLAENEKSSYSNKTLFPLYEQRVENLCKKYDYKPKIVELKDNFLEITEKNKYDFFQIKKDHLENMNSIYKCGLITTQKKSYLLIKKDILKKGSDVSKKIARKIDSNITKLDALSNSLKCKQTNDSNSVQKLVLLKQATYQTCKYINYLEYLKEFNKKNIIKTEKFFKDNLEDKGEIKEENKTYTPDHLIKQEIQTLNQLNNEINHTYKVFPMAFHAYTAYENNITAHILLQLLKEDYKSLRDKLHKTLNPINQVVYKISNAMKK